MRTSGPPLALAEPVRLQLQATDSTVSSADIRPAGHYLDNASASRRFSLELLAGFAAVALVMAAVGIYGVVAYTVAQRTREIGVRLALGARGTNIALLVVGEGLRRTAAGIVAGLAGALAATGAVRSLLFGVGATDPATYGGVVALLLAVTVLACLLPAWRAARVDPQIALRGD